MACGMSEQAEPTFDVMLSSYQNHLYLVRNISYASIMSTYF
jgi:hypothetical protein